MKAWLLKGYNQPLEPIERNRPQPAPGEILLKVKACGLCYTDIKIIKGEIPPPIVTLPHVLGHEVAGEVAEIGSGVSGIGIGDLGVVYSLSPATIFRTASQEEKTYLGRIVLTL